MFYSETLLSKTGPLARVWLSANVERKLKKHDILQSDIGDSVNAIVDRGSAPLALRLSGQLLLGVVRIYSRKARYLLDDCNEAILKIKMVCGGRDYTLRLIVVLTAYIRRSVQAMSTSQPNPIPPTPPRSTCPTHSQKSTCLDPVQTRHCSSRNSPTTIPVY